MVIGHNSTRIDLAPLAALPGYHASATGEIINKHGRVMKQRLAANGASMVDIGKKTHMVHHLVLRAHTGRPFTKGYRPKHRNGDKSDNRLENLMWAGKPA